VDWSQERFEHAFGRSMEVGDQGWPTIRYFNKETGYQGKPYRKKTDQEVSEELGDVNRMFRYITDYGGTSLCDVVYGDDCTVKELEFLDQWWKKKAQNKDLVEKELRQAQQDLVNGAGKYAVVRRKTLLLNNILSKDDAN